jgi:excisionase family DNA binding protein
MARRRNPEESAPNWAVTSREAVDVARRESGLPDWIYDCVRAGSAAAPFEPIRAGSPPPLLTVRETAAALRVSERTVRRLIARGALRAARVGRSIRLRSRDIEILLRQPLQVTGRHDLVSLKH